ncbi:MAG: 1-deoxy-D-xylulose-5-phosphate reductoisomerase [Dehalococcoidia bacterium]|nr:1-deoxy-D-xylulose-5-phosphate reductoisomerase [Dehalococcoidia bacterium]
MPRRIKKVAILGSTGSIGQQTLDIIRALNTRFQIVGLAAGTNTELLARQIDEFQPRLFSCSAEPDFGCAAQFLPMEGMVTDPEVDLVVIATSGKSGLYPLLAAVRAGKTVALANKETLVMAGEIILREARQHRAKILPIDSEHSAVWQCLRGERTRIERIFLTASGGPFYHFSPARLEQVTAQEALQHPVWKMGRKVTIDSATLMNKGLEMIEAHWLFAVPFDNIEVLLHPQCIVHSMVEFADGCVKAQLGFPDMRLPIQYAICYPERLSNTELPRLDLHMVQALNFQSVDEARFPCLTLARNAARMGGTYPAVLCAADEVAVELFLSHRTRFVDIARIVEETLEEHRAVARPTLDAILQADAWARKRANQISLRYAEAHPRPHKGTPVDDPGIAK